MVECFYTVSQSVSELDCTDCLESLPACSCVVSRLPSHFQTSNCINKQQSRALPGHCTAPSPPPPPVSGSFPGQTGGKCQCTTYTITVSSVRFNTNRKETDIFRPTVALSDRPIILSPHVSRYQNMTTSAS